MSTGTDMPSELGKELLEQMYQAAGEITVFEIFPALDMREDKLVEMREAFGYQVKLTKIEGRAERNERERHQGRRRPKPYYVRAEGGKDRASKSRGKRGDGKGGKSVSRRRNQRTKASNRKGPRNEEPEYVPVGGSQQENSKQDSKSKPRKPRNAGRGGKKNRESSTDFVWEPKKENKPEEKKD